MKNIKDYIGKLPDKTPEFRFTGNLFKRYPELLEYAPIPENHRINYVLTPITRSWYFMHNDKPFNFYPIWLKLTSINTGIVYQSISYKLSIKQSAESTKSNKLKI